MKENNINNAAANNNFNNSEGGIVMTTGTMTMDVFAGTVKEALYVYFEDCTIQIQEVKKNNGRILHGISIREQESNLAPTIYLEAFFEQYQDGRSFVDIVKDPIRAKQPSTGRLVACGSYPNQQYFHRKEKIYGATRKDRQSKRRVSAGRRQADAGKA